MPSTDIIIVSYKDEVPIKSCLSSIEKWCNNYHLFVEDNNVENRGFTRAVNDGIKKGLSPFIWLVNSDVIVMENAQGALIEHFSYNEKVGIVGSMQLDPNNPDRIAFGGATRAFPSGIHKGGRVSMGHCRIPEKQTWVNAASMMIRRDMIKTVGLLDENMFLLYSDSSFCYTVRSYGYEVWYTPYSKVLHTLGASRNISEWHKKDMEAFMAKWDIKYVPEAKAFEYSEEFQKLDLFP